MAEIERWDRAMAEIERWDRAQARAYFGMPYLVVDDDPRLTEAQ